MSGAQSRTDVWDVAVVGGGPGGYVAAIRAAQLGLRTVCIERDALGGICLNWGCIPTKALLHSAETYRALRERGAGLGLVLDGLSFELGAIVARSRKVAERLSRGVAYLFGKYGVTHERATARLLEPGRLALHDRHGAFQRELRARHIVLATGARPRALPGVPFDGRRVISSREAMVPEELPARLVIVGAGAIGVEFASFYAALGTQVTIVEALDRLVPHEDDEVSEALERSFRRRGIGIHTATRVVAADEGPQGALHIAVESGEGKRETLVADRMLVAIGVRGNVEDLGLEACGVELERGWIRVDGSYRTTATGIYAIGDVAGPPWLAHVASAEGICCVERIAGIDRPDVDYASIPACTYCHPEIGSVGLTERAVRAQGRPYRVGRFPLTANGRALSMDEPEGFVKVIFDGHTGELLGASVVGANASEIVHELALAKRAELTHADVHALVHAHPTLSEATAEAVAAAFGLPIHI